jgi:uncharacterized protein (DUF952 family)
MTPAVIYKICTAEEWAAAETAGRFTGSPVDVADGFIHFSTAEQAEETARRHFAGQTGLVLVSVDAKVIADKLTWEPSRGGDLFPHLYTPLDLDVVTSVRPLSLGDDGAHVFPELS